MYIKQILSVKHRTKEQISMTYVGLAVVLLEYENEVGDGEHSDELLVLAVPEGGRADAVVDEGEEGLLDQQLRVEDHHLGALGHDVVAELVLHEVGEDLVVLWAKRERGGD
jgi:hypothetical protein